MHPGFPFLSLFFCFGFHGKALSRTLPDKSPSFCKSCLKRRGMQAAQRSMSYAPCQAVPAMHSCVHSYPDPTCDENFPITLLPYISLMH